MKIDVEGHETAVLAGAETTIISAKPDIMLSAHGYQKRDECVRLLEGWSYSVSVIHEVEQEGDYGLLATFGPE